MKNYLKISLLFILILGLSGCSNKLEVQTIQSERIKLNLQEPNQLDLDKVQFFIITKDNKDNIFQELKNNNLDEVLFGLSDKDYEKLSSNMLELKHYIIQQRKIIKAYKDYYEPNMEIRDQK